MTEANSARMHPNYVIKDSALWGDPHQFLAHKSPQRAHAGLTFTCPPARPRVRALSRAEI
jgi:hypothetical protein